MKIDDKIINVFKGKGYCYKFDIIYNSSSKSCILEKNSLVIILDFNVSCENSDQIDYRKLTSFQNELFYQYEQVYRFEINNHNDIVEMMACIDLFRSDDFTNQKSKSSRDNYYLDNSMLEYFFEECFIDIYGENYLDCLDKEHSLNDIYGNSLYVDYCIKKKNLKIAIEENGITYHHPQIIGKEKYKKQLMRQNSLSYYHYKVYRFSTENLKCKEAVCDSMLKYFGDKDEFLTLGQFNECRNFQLYEHQDLTIESINIARGKGINSFLVVQPTATGKTTIVFEDLVINAGIYKNILILVPSVSVKDDWAYKISCVKKFESMKFTIKCYSGFYRKYLDIDSSFFDYVIIDEAHHAVAPTLKRVINYLNPLFLIGLTATPDRLDRKKLEDIFSTRNISLSLEEAIEKNIIPPISCYRLNSNLDLSNIRYNGKDYCSTDLEKLIHVHSRIELITDSVQKYFSNLKNLRAIVFCINKNHAKKMNLSFRKKGFKSSTIISGDKNSANTIKNFKDGFFNILCSVNKISEGFDYPDINLLVMARPTMSKVLYLQQIGRGLRRAKDKKQLFVLDVVDNYGVYNKPWSSHAIFNIDTYTPFNLLPFNSRSNLDFTYLDGLLEYEESISKIDIFTLQSKYEGYFTLTQTARELFIGDSTLISWIKKQKIFPDFSHKFGNRYIYYFSQMTIDSIIKKYNLKVHNSNTILEDFINFVNTKNYTFSFKMVFLLSFFKNSDENFVVNIDSVLTDYKSFYLERLNEGLPIDKSNCVYDERKLNNLDYLKKSMMQNPFEKFERKRFIYYAKDLSELAMNENLVCKLTDVKSIYRIYLDHLKEYYKDLGGLQKNMILGDFYELL